MKKVLKVCAVIVIALMAMLSLTACGEKKDQVTFDGKEGKITFSVKKGANYRISTDKKDLRTSREQGALVGDNFKIGIEFCDDYKYFFDSSLDKMKEKKKDNTDYKEVKYAGVDGVQYFYGGYNCYEVLLPVKNNEKYYLILTIYGKEDNEQSAKDAMNNKELTDILDSIVFEAK